MFSDLETIVLTLHSSRLGLYLLSAIILLVIALTLNKQRIAVAKYLVVTSLLYFLFVLAMPIYAGYAGASPSFDELDYQVYSQGIKLIVALLLVVNLVLVLVGIRGLIRKFGLTISVNNS